jgi:hypothetical protein
MFDRCSHGAGVLHPAERLSDMSMISPLRILALSGTLLLSACGQDESAPPKPSKPEDRIALKQALFEPLEPAAFEKAVAAARAGGVNEQAIIEARFLSLIDRADYAGIAKLVPDLETRNASFELKDSAIFATTEEWLAVVQYARALAALEQDDKAAFKKHITEAFWLSPRQGAIFGPHIERLRLKEAMSRVRIDFQRSFINEETGQPVTLKAVAGDSTHLLFHFWSPWSRECEINLPDFIATSKELARNDVAVASVLAEPDPAAVPDAGNFRSNITEKISVTWLIDDNTAPTTQLLRIQNLPTMVLADTNGSILFNGHPSDPELWSALQKVAPNVVRPAVDAADPPSLLPPSE